MHVKINVIFSLNCDQYFLNQNCVYFELMSFEELQSAIMVRKTYMHMSKSHKVLIVIFYFFLFFILKFPVLKLEL